MNKVATFFYKKSTLITSLLITVITFAYIYFVLIDAAKGFEVANSTSKTLGLSFGFSYDQVHEFFSIRTNEMIASYKALNNVWDSLFAILYGLMYVFWLSLLFKPYQNTYKFINLLPLGQVFFDWLENSKLSEFSNSYLVGQPISSIDVQVASVFVMIKWSIALLVFIAIILGLLLRVRDIVNKKVK